MPLKLRRRKDSPYIYIRGTLRGEYVDETTGTDHEETAEALRIQKENEILQRGVFGARATATFIDAALLYIEAGGSKRFVGKFDESTGKWDGLMGHFEHMKLSGIGQIELDAAAVKMLPDAAPATRNRQIYTPFIAIWGKAHARGLCEFRRWERPKQSRGKRRLRWATIEEARRLVDAAPRHLKPLIVFLIYTGARMAEAIDLDWSDVDLSQRWVVFRETKRKDEDRGVPLHAEAVVALGNMRHRKGRVFLTHRGVPYADKERLEGGQIKTGWRLLCERAEVQGLTPHGLRHTFSTWLTMTGVSEQIRDELMGHWSSATGRIYAHIPRAELTAAVDRLPGLGPVEYGPAVARRKA